MSSQPHSIPAEKRDSLGTRASRRLRKSGRLPAVIYGHQQEVASVHLPLRETVDHLSEGRHLFEISVDGVSEQCLVKEVQYDHLGADILHVDLFRVNLDEEITTDIPIILVGEAHGVRLGGTLSHSRDSVEVTAKVRDLPDEIRVDVSGLEIGQSLHAGELPLPDGVKLADDAEQVIASVTARREEVEELDTEAPTEPEIVEKGKKEEGEEEEKKGDRKAEKKEEK